MRNEVNASLRTPRYLSLLSFIEENFSIQICRELPGVLFAAGSARKGRAGRIVGAGLPAAGVTARRRGLARRERCTRTAARASIGSSDVGWNRSGGWPA